MGHWERNVYKSFRCENGYERQSQIPIICHISVKYTRHSVYINPSFLFQLNPHFLRMFVYRTMPRFTRISRKQTISTTTKRKKNSVESVSIIPKSYIDYLENLNGNVIFC